MKPDPATTSGPERRFGAVARRLAVVCAVTAAGCVLVLLYSDVARGFDYDALIKATRRTPPSAIAWSLAATVLSFAAVVGRDASALRYIQARLPWRAVVLGGFCGTALGNAVGFGTLTGGAVRYRIYGAVGVKPDDIARLVVFLAGGFGIGLAGFGGLTALVEAIPVAHFLGWPPLLLRAVAALALAATIAIVTYGLRGTIRIGRFTFGAPSSSLTAMQLLLTGARLIGAAAALWVLMPPLPPSAPINFFSFAAIFSVATALGVASNVPGGLGVFEAVVLAAFGGRAAPDRIAAALLVFRGMYFLLPLVASAILLAAFELAGAAGGGTPQRDDPVARTAARLSPSFLGVITFAVGAWLVFSGVTPAFDNRLAFLSVRLPLWFVESSHFFGSLVGVVFLFVARGLFNRRDGAWWLALVLAIASLGLSLAKGLAYNEAGFLTILICLLVATRRQFNQPASMLGQPFTGGWFAAVLIIIVASGWLLLFVFHDVRFSSRDLWWQFEFDAQAPRALRAMVGVSVLGIVIGVLQLLRPPRGYAEPPDASELARAATIIRGQPRSDPMLALMGDKSILFSASGGAFLMFGKRGRSWIALFDPVGSISDWPELIGRLVELAHAHGGRAAFYQVRPEHLPLYLDAGLTVLKLGEEARVPLSAFNLQGSQCANLRYAMKRGERDGLGFELLVGERVAAAFDELAAVSADWLARRRRGGSAERGFSVAAFEPGYVASQKVGLVRQHGVAVAFATVMYTGLRDEASVGLMRHTRAASPYAMEFLFTHLLLAFRDLGYRSFSLGMAPLAGLQRRPLSSRWHWLGALIWRHGNPIYNFQGLRVFKGKFNPSWEPRYLAASGTLGPFVALLDVAGLVAARYRGSRTALRHGHLE